MSHSVSHRGALVAALCLAGLSGPAPAQSPVKYPATRKDATTDTYFGIRVADP
jgi:hypothetical protein